MEIGTDGTPKQMLLKSTETCMEIERREAYMKHSCTSVRWQAVSVEIRETNVYGMASLLLRILTKNSVRYVETLLIARWFAALILRVFTVCIR